MVGGGVQCGVGAVRQGLWARLAQLLRLREWQAPRPAGGPSTHEVAQGSPAVFPVDSQRIQSAREWAIVCCKGGRGAGALVRRLPNEASSVTIIREADGHYYASFVVDVEPTLLPVVESEAAVDMGIARLATIATTGGARRDLANPKHLRRKLRKLRRLEREKSRRQKGSANRNKTRRKIANAHNEVSRARQDYHHKQALALVRENQVIHVEDLNIVSMVRNRPLAQAISDAGWGEFVRIIAEEADHYGRTVHTVSRWLASSKTCSACGHRLHELRCRSGSGDARRVAPCTTATTTPPKSFSPPGGRRDRTPVEPM